MADKFGGQKDGRQTTGATFYDVPAVPVNANALYFPNFPASPFFGVAEYPVAAGDLGAFSTAGVFVFDKPAGWIDNAGRKVFYRPKTAATGEIVAQEIKGDVLIGYQIIDNINPQKLGVLLASPEFCMTVLMVTSTADSGAGSLRQAIADAQDGDVILFDADVFPVGQTTSILLSSYITITKSVSIYAGESDGQGGYTSGATKRYYVYRDVEGVKTKVYIDDNNPTLEGETTLFDLSCRVALDGQSSVRCVYATMGAALVVAGICFANGMTTANGGGFSSDGNSQSTINDCHITGCSATSGGGVYSRDTSQNTLNVCTIDGCSATNGGGIESYNSSQNTLNGCIITNCAATSYGGGVYSYLASKNTLNGCTIYGCTATNGGGVHAASTSQSTLNDCHITGCSATSGGGGLQLTNNSQNALNNCQITGCSANNAGAMFIRSSSQATLNDCTASDNTATQGADRRDIVLGETASTIISNSSVASLRCDATGAQLTISGKVTTITELVIVLPPNDPAYPITINDGAALTITTSATIGAATLTSAGRGYLAVGAGIDTSTATLTNVVLCAYGAGLESFEISADGASWTADDLTTPILIETRDAGGDWQTLTDNATGGEYATTFALESTARAFDGVAFFVATLPGYWQADAGAVDSNDWIVKGFAAANSNGGGDVDAAQGWTVTPSTVTPNADGV